MALLLVPSLLPAQNYVGTSTTLVAPFDTPPRTADFDGDGRDDVIGASSMPNSLVYFGETSGSFTPNGTPLWSWASPISVHPCDVDVDGAPDAIVLNVDSTAAPFVNLTFLRNDGFGTLDSPFAPLLPTLDLGPAPSAFRQLIVDDFNGDGLPCDLAILTDSALIVRLQSVPGFVPVIVTASVAIADGTTMVAGNVDGIAGIDFVVGHDTGDVSVVTFDAATATLATPSALGLMAGPVTGLSNVDLDGDNDLDLAATTASVIALFANDGSGSYTQIGGTIPNPSMSSSGVGAIVAGQYDLSPFGDFVVATGAAEPARYVGSGMTGPTDVGATLFPGMPIGLGDHLTTGDYDGDGVDDVVGVFLGGPALSAAISVQIFRRGDVNSDGSVDVSDAAYWLAYFNGTQPLLCPDAADVNDDGLLDLADVSYLYSALFIAGSPPIPAPFGACGLDPTPDALSSFGYGAGC